MTSKLVTQSKAAKKEPDSLWWFGGISAALAAMCTHPLDTIKVRLQTATTKASLVKTITDMAKKEGLVSFYAGISASLLRQLTYSTARFSVYETMREKLSDDKGYISPANKLIAGLTGGVVGGFVGNPADRANVMMQNDGKLPVELRKNYQSVFHALVRMVREEGWKGLIQGLGPNILRGMLMTASQIATYDIFKQSMLDTGYFKDNLTTHFGASTLAALVATTATNPIDVVKTRIMSSPPGTYKGTIDGMVKIVTKEGTMALMKGWTPSFTRL
ncbi:hypothetical protein HK098_002666 [Nowakowskiella sp. JEL0407]|nr:hypothetical protein HK098_002666 [Nowakowskiella sp. JEL0407]